jgi:hypothetical protein
MPSVSDGIHNERSDDEERARAAHRRAKEVLEEVRSRWGAESPTSGLPAMIARASPEEVVHGLSCLYIFASRVGGATADDPAVAQRWLTGWSGARARVPDDGRAALDAGIAFAARLHDAMGLADAESAN